MDGIGDERASEIASRSDALSDSRELSQREPLTLLLTLAVYHELCYSFDCEGDPDFERYSPQVDALLRTVGDERETVVSSAEDEKFRKLTVYVSPATRRRFTETVRNFRLDGGLGPIGAYHTSLVTSALGDWEEVFSD